MGTQGQACICPGQAAPGKVLLSRLLVPCCVGPSVTPCTGTGFAANANATPVSCVDFLIIGCQVKKK